MKRVVLALVVIFSLSACGGGGSGPSETTAQFRFTHHLGDLCRHIEGRLEVGGAVILSANGVWSAKTTLNNCGTLRVNSSFAYVGAPLPCGWSDGYSYEDIKCGKHNLFDWQVSKSFTVTTGPVQN